MAWSADDGPRTGIASRELLPILREIGDLKRITSAGRPGSIAERLFRTAWRDLVGGRAPDDVMLATSASALAATRLGDLDIPTLQHLGLDRDRARDIAAKALDEVVAGLDPELHGRLRAALADDLPAPPGRLPPFVQALAGQPRAGATCPGRARIVLQPAENHAEHCLAVAVGGVLLAPAYGADPTTVFLAGLAHHLHNAAMPDSGFTGEMLLELNLADVIRTANEMALAELNPSLRHTIERAREILADADTPDGRAFHAADVIDRVIEIDQHLAVARLSMDRILGEMALVHDGPVKLFHDRVLAEMGLP